MKSVEGRVTYGELLRTIAGRHVDEHVRFFMETRTPGVNELRDRFHSLLNTELDEKSAFELGKRAKHVKETLERLALLIQVHRRSRSRTNREMLERVLSEYERILKVIRQGRRR